jgi:hypothetical protein
VSIEQWIGVKWSESSRSEAVSHHPGFTSKELSDAIVRTHKSMTVTAEQLSRSILRLYDAAARFGSEAERVSDKAERSPSDKKAE